LEAERLGGVRWDRTVGDGVNRQVYFRTTRVVLRCPDQPHRLIWITQALRGIDLMTSQGQTIITFLGGITGLVIPALVLIIAPIALMIAISHTLNKLATDSRDHRDECRRLLAVPAVSPVLLRHLRGGIHSHLHRRLSRS
jgi:hypothetical protein